MSQKPKFLDPHFKSQLQSKTARKRKKHADHTDIAAEASKPPRNDLHPKLQMESRPIASLKAAKRRVRKTAPEQLKRVISSINRFGLVAPILINGDREIIDGHIVVEAAKKLGLTTIPCVMIDHLSEEEVRALRISHNRLGETGEWDLKELRLELIELEELNIDLQDTSFSVPEIDILKIEPADEAKEESEGEEEMVGEPVARGDDLFRLGDHFLLCGDSLKQQSYKTLLGDAVAHCVFSDPPYNCPIKGFVGGLGAHKHQDFAMAVGEKSDEEFLDFLKTYLDHCRTFAAPAAVIYACMDHRQIDLLMMAGRLAGLKRLNMAVWNKGSGGMGSLYRSAHELVAIFCTAEAPATNHVMLGANGRDRTNVWSYPGANRKGSSAADALAIHPTPKPVELVADALRDVTNPGDIVLDPFMGSGSTIMAAEKTGRRAYGIEYDPKYVDAAIRRWQQLTAKEAVHVASGKSFAALAMDRMGLGGDDLAEEPANSVS